MANVCVCAVYGFLGNATMEGLVQDHLQLHASFDAFVVGPEERYEPLGVEADAERVDGADVCADLRRRGFGRCEAHLQPYQPMRFVNDTTPMHCLVEQGNYMWRGDFFLHYPYRTGALGGFVLSRRMRLMWKTAAGSVRAYTWTEIEQYFSTYCSCVFVQPQSTNVTPACAEDCCHARTYLCH
eukprot:6205560-Pleurochrysis_carterae.AAC.2